MYDRILLPTDGSPGMDAVVDHCLHQAEQNDAILHVLYVVDLRAYVVLPEETQQRVVDVLEGEGRTAVERVRERAEQRDVEVVAALEHGVPHEVILAYADEADVDLIVMGTHGRSGDENRILGSVAEEVVRRAPIPVLTVHMGESATPIEPPEREEDQRRYIA